MARAAVVVPRLGVSLGARRRAVGLGPLGAVAVATVPTVPVLALLVAGATAATWGDDFRDFSMVREPGYGWRVDFMEHPERSEKIRKDPKFGWMMKSG